MVQRRELPKYQMIRDELLSWIEVRSLVPGDRLPTEADLAEHFVVSRQTIRQAVGELVQKGVLERIQGSGTYYRGRLGSNTERTSSGMIGVITTYISDYIFPHIIRGIEERLSANGYSPLLFSTQNDPKKERKALESLFEKGVDGVIAEATKSAYTNRNADLLYQLEERNIPIVMLHATYPDLSVPLVEVDDRYGGYLATKHLVDLGHTRIGAILKMDDRQGLRRMEGYLRALSESGRTFNSDAVAFYATEEGDSVVSSYGMRIMQLEPAARPTAVFCYNDTIATELISELGNKGLVVPRDISIIGFDDAPLASRSHPPLTTIEHPKYDMGVQAGDLILQLMKHEETIQRVYTFTPKLIIRASTQTFN